MAALSRELEAGVGVGVLVRSCVAPQKLASTSQALAEHGAQTFLTSSISPGWNAASAPAPQSPEREQGIRTPSAGLWLLRT